MTLMNKKLSFTLFLTCLCILFAGCQHTEQLDTTQAWLKPGVAVNLPSPQLPQSFEVQQLLTIEFDGQTHHIMTMLQANGQQLALVGLTPTGIVLFKLEYTSEGIVTHQYVTTAQLPAPTQVLSDIMLAYWPVDDWQGQLPQGWTLQDSEDIRVLLDETGQQVQKISYTKADGELVRHPIQLEHYVFGYRILLETIQ